MSSRLRVCIVTAGHVSTCPRMLKAADALAEEYDVRVVSVRHTPWADEADAAIARSRRWPLTAVDHRRLDAPATYYWSGARHQLARRWARWTRWTSLASGRVPGAIGARAFGRVHSELVRAIRAERADIIYGGTTGALAAIAEAAGDMRVPYALDLEDFHAGEHCEPEGALDNRLADGILRRVLPGAACLTTASSAMADAYASAYGVRPTVVHNTFPLPTREPSPLPFNGALRCYWFSQTIGRGRGLEEFVQAAGAASIPCTLTLRGNNANGYCDELRALAARVAPRLEVIQDAPAHPDDMVTLCREHHVGLGLEAGQAPNRALALSNKVLTYPLAGLALLMTDTLGQRELSADIPGTVLPPPGNVDALADVLRRWSASSAALDAARRAAWEAARRRWHWEHPAERGALRAAISRVIEERS